MVEGVEERSEHSPPTLTLWNVSIVRNVGFGGDGCPHGMVENEVRCKNREVMRQDKLLVEWNENMQQQVPRGPWDVKDQE
jgi:hypothetical protein